MKEIWRTLPKSLGYKDIYQVSNLGRLRAVAHYDRNKHFHHSRIHKLSRSRRGYLRVHLHKRDNQSVTVPIHRLIALTFIGNPKNNQCIVHVNGDVDNNRVSNLRWGKRNSRKHTDISDKMRPKHSLNRKSIYVDQLHASFPTLISAAHQLEKLNPCHTVSQYYHGLSKIIHIHGYHLYNHYTGHLIKSDH